MKYKKVTQYKVNKVSPFFSELYDMKISSKKRYLAGKSPSRIVNHDTGEVEGTQIFAINQKVDSEQFTKIFRKGLAGMFDLSKAGVKVFTYIASIAKPNKDVIYFEIDDCKAYTGYKTHVPILTGLAELIELQFIARTKAHYKYFINPTMFFNGSRIAFIKSYEIDGASSETIEIKANPDNLLLE